MTRTRRRWRKQWPIDPLCHVEQFLIGSATGLVILGYRRSNLRQDHHVRFRWSRESSLGSHADSVPSVLLVIGSVTGSFLAASLIRLKCLRSLHCRPPDVSRIGRAREVELPGRVREVEACTLSPEGQGRHVVRSCRHLGCGVGPEPYPGLLVGLTELTDPLVLVPPPHSPVYGVACLPEDPPASSLLRPARSQQAHLLVGLCCPCCARL